MLSYLNYDLIAVSTIRKAIEIISEVTEIDYLITDYYFSGDPDNNGLDVARIFRIKHCNAPLVLMTGSVLDKSQTQLLTNTYKGHFLSKPFAKADLQKVLKYG